MADMTEELEDGLKEEETRLGEMLSALNEKQYHFWELMNGGGVTGAEAYKAAYGCEGWTKASLAVSASRLWNGDKFALIRVMLKNSVVEQVARSLEYRIAELEAFAERCENAGQYGASGKARELIGKLEGHYVIKTQNVSNRNDDLAVLKDIAKEGSKESVAFALKEAKSIGLEKELKAALKTIH